MGGEFYRQGSPGTTGWKMVQKSYGEKCLSGLWSLTIILGREKFFEIIGNAYQKYLPLISHFLCSTDLCLVAQMVKNPPAVQETWVQSLGWEDLLEKRMAADASILAWRIPWTEELGELHSPGGHKQSDTTEQLTLSLWLSMRQASKIRTSLFKSGTTFRGQKTNLEQLCWFTQLQRPRWATTSGRSAYEC